VENEHAEQDAATSVEVTPTWRRRTALPEFPPLADETWADSVVIGGGVTGLGLALRLVRAGQRVVVLERRRLGSGTTGASTAHLTSALDLPWDEVVARFGRDRARLVADSIEASIQSIEHEARSHGGDGIFTWSAGYRVAETEAELEALEREERAARDLGLAVALLRELPQTVRARGALRFASQAELDPLAYLAVLMRSFVELGGRIFEESPVSEADGEVVVAGSGRSVRADAVIDATHTPIGSAASIQTRLVPSISYVVAARLEQPLAPGLFWDCADPYHYLRSVPPDRRLVLVGGEDHRVGSCAEPAARFGALEAWARARLPVASIESRWSAELFTSSDGLPYIGRLPGARSRFIAAGFAGTGLTFGSVAATLLSDLVLGEANPWEPVYRPSRIGPWAGIASAVREGAATAWRFAADRLPSAGGDSAGEIPRDSGRIVRVGGRQRAVYRDLSGELHQMSARCTHMGCIVRWNELEKTWDCPCHGGRFHRTGKVLYGPPTRDLDRVGDASARRAGKGLASQSVEALRSAARRTE